MKMNRTICACDECKACCKRQPGPLAPGDFERIAKYLGQTPEEAKMLFKASDGCVVQLRKTGELLRIGTITPKQKPNGRCVFLDQNDHCLIHPVAPFGCAYFDVHMAKPEADRRSVFLAGQQATSRQYQELRKSIAGDKNDLQDNKSSV